MTDWPGPRRATTPRTCSGSTRTSDRPDCRLRPHASDDPPSRRVVRVLRCIIAPCPRQKTQQVSACPASTPFNPPRGLTVAVVGATGLVGRTMVEVLAERGFPVRTLRPLASRADGRSVSFAGRDWPVEESGPDAFEGVDIALFSAGAACHATWRRRRPAGAPWSSTTPPSGAWSPASRSSVARSTPRMPPTHEGIIANPNCSTMQLVPLLMALRDTVGLERVIVDTYQSVSGTGAEAVDELEAQVRAHVAGEPTVASVYPAPDRLQRAARDRRVPRRRLHQGGVEGHRGEPQDPPPAGPAGLVHRGPGAGVHVALGGRPRRDARSDHARSAPGAVRAGARGGGGGRPARRTGIRWPSTPRAATRSSWAASARTPRATTVAGWRSGWSRTTSARAPPRTPSQIAELVVRRGWLDTGVPRGTTGAA